MAIYTTELLTDRDYNIPEGRLPLEYAVDTANKAKTHSENADAHLVTDSNRNLFAGHNTSASEGDCVVVGHSAKGWARSTALGYKADASHTSVAVGYSAKNGNTGAVAVGGETNANLRSVAVGWTAKGNAYCSVAVGAAAEATGHFSTAIGNRTKNKDRGVAVIGTGTDPDKHATSFTTQTLFYIMGAGSELANTYEDGEACLGYLVKNADGTVLAAGTRKLSELLTNNTTFAPASLDPEAEPPKVFLPTGATDPIEDLELPPDMEQPQEQA
jgi:hypothetical protein